MALPHVLTVGGLALGIVGAATASDAISLREVAHAANFPLLSGAIVLARQALPNSVAHTLEPLAAVLGVVAVAAPIIRTRARASAAASGSQPGRVTASAQAL
ncbi:MAG: hypothetical protein M3336_03665 [Chloroflexota bacterium]|nr:hypothetical protein [Chloroflexota bacterium]